MTDQPTPRCPNGHEWTHQFGDDWTPERGTRCDCGKKQWGIADRPTPEPTLLTMSIGRWRQSAQYDGYQFWLRNEVEAQAAKVAELEADLQQARERADELASCSCCEYEFEGSDRKYNVVCEKCWSGAAALADRDRLQRVVDEMRTWLTARVEEYRSILTYGYDGSTCEPALALAHLDLLTTQETP